VCKHVDDAFLTSHSLLKTYHSFTHTHTDISDHTSKNKLRTDYPTTVPIFQTSTFDDPSGEYDYSRSGNPTRDALQELCRRVEGNEAVSSFAFTSGMSALSATLRLLKPGDIVLASKDLYGGMHRLLTHCVEHSGLDVRFVETWDLSKFKKELHSSSRVRMVFLESPTNPMMHVSDIRELAKLTHARAALLAVDNSIMTPVLSKPLDLGADLVIHSATKFLSGHSDTVGGIVTVVFVFFLYG